MRRSLFLSLVLAGCVTVPGTGHKAFIAIPRSQEIAMGTEAYAQVLSEAKAKGTINHDPRLNAILQRVGKRIAAVTPVTDFQWEFTLIDSKEMNAFCLPGGKVVVYTGILPVVQNEAGLAIVLGHEVAHAVARHGAQRMTQSLGVQLGLALIDASILRDKRYRDLAMAALGAGATGLIILPYSRGHESEADTLGLDYAAEAGYDPAEGPRFWQRFASKAGGAGVPWFLSTHPTDQSRIENMNRLLAHAEELYQKSPKYGLGETL